MAFSLINKIFISFAIIISIVISVLLFLYLPAIKNEIYITYPTSSDIINIIKQNFIFNKEYTNYTEPEDTRFDNDYNFYILKDKLFKDGNTLVVNLDNIIKESTFERAKIEYIVYSKPYNIFFLDLDELNKIIPLQKQSLKKLLLGNIVFELSEVEPNSMISRRFSNIEPNIDIYQIKSISVPNISPSINCIVSEWSEWNLCDDKCVNNCLQTRNRNIIRNKLTGGNDCPALIETQPCPPVNCVVGEWSEWSLCDDKCINNCEQKRTREIIRNSVRGGTQCPVLIESRQCSPVDCVLGEWSQWGKCDKLCGEGGKQERYREIIRKPLYGGKICDITREERQCNKLDCVKDFTGNDTPGSEVAKYFETYLNNIITKSTGSILSYAFNQIDFDKTKYDTQTKKLIVSFTSEKDVNRIYYTVSDNILYIFDEIVNEPISSVILGNLQLDLRLYQFKAYPRFQNYAITKITVL